MGMKNKISLENDEGRFFIHTFIYIKNTPPRVFSQMYREAIRFQYFTHEPRVGAWAPPAYLEAPPTFFFKYMNIYCKITSMTS